jgi:glucose/arabinose dehydrogenase
MKTICSMSAQRSFIRHWKLISRSVAVVDILFASALVQLGATSSSAVEPLNALVPTTVEVPPALRDVPFDQDRVLMVPPGFKISVVASIPGARFIMPLSTGEIFVAQPGLGSILLLRPQANGTAAVSALIQDLQNPQGMALHRSEDRLYLYVGESDDILYPFRNSWQDSGSIDYGKRITSYIDDHPPDEFQDSKTPEPFREGIAIALHGSWDRSRKAGYKVIFFPWQGRRPGRQIDLVTGWLDDRSQSQWGRPVDVKPANDGSVLISDDYSGTIYRLARTVWPSWPARSMFASNEYCVMVR